MSTIPKTVLTEGSEEDEFTLPEGVQPFLSASAATLTPPHCTHLWGEKGPPSTAIDRVLQLHRFGAVHAFEPSCPPAVAALARIAVFHWPEQLDLDNNGGDQHPRHWADEPVDVHPSPVAADVVRHSARRVAVCILAEMMNYKEYCIALAEAPGFLAALPSVLSRVLHTYVALATFRSVIQ